MSAGVTTWAELRASLARVALIVDGERGTQLAVTSRDKSRAAVYDEVSEAARVKDGTIGTGRTLYSDSLRPRKDPDTILARRILREVRDAETGRDRPVAPVQRKVTAAPVTRARDLP